MSDRQLSADSIVWIPVGESLPDLHQRVLIFAGGHVLGGYRFERSRWMNDTGDFLQRSVTHWARMPAGPRKTP